MFRSFVHLNDEYIMNMHMNSNVYLYLCMYNSFHNIIETIITAHGIIQDGDSVV